MRWLFHSSYQQQNNSGIPNKSEQELKDAAMALVTAIPSTIAQDFKVFDYTAYSLYAHELREKSLMNSKYTVENYDICHSIAAKEYGILAKNEETSFYTTDAIDKLWSDFF
jgi:hypothetical protein